MKLKRDLITFITQTTHKTNNNTMKKQTVDEVSGYADV